MPVRTGLAWSPVSASTAGYDPLLGSAGSLWGTGGFSATLDFGPAGGSTALTAASSGGTGGGSAGAGQGDLWSTWRSLGLTKLLKKAYHQQQRRGGGAGSTGSSQAQQQLQQTQQTVQAALQQMQAALARSQAVLQEQLLLQLQVPALPQAGGGGDSSGVAIGEPLLLEGLATAAGDGASGSGSGTAGALVPAGVGAGGASGSAAAAQLLGGVDSSGLALAAAAAAITRPAADSSNMDCLARRTDQLSFAAGEQDRSRLIKVCYPSWQRSAVLWLLRTALHVGSRVDVATSRLPSGGRYALRYAHLPCLRLPACAALLPNCWTSNFHPWWHSWWQVVERLVELGADLHLTDNEGRTALHLGEWSKQCACCSTPRALAVRAWRSCSG